MKIILLQDVDEFIESLQKPTRSKWLRLLTLLSEYGENLGMPHLRQIGSGISELRVRGKQEVRAFATFKENLAIIVHAFVKKTQKIPQREIDIAWKRIQSLTEI